MIFRRYLQDVVWDIFLEIKEYTYWDLTLEYQSTLDVEVTRGP